MIVTQKASMDWSDSASESSVNIHAFHDSRPSNNRNHEPLEVAKVEVS